MDGRRRRLRSSRTESGVQVDSSVALLVIVVLMALELLIRTSVLVDVRQCWWAFDGLVTALTAQRRPRNGLGTATMGCRGADIPERRGTGGGAPGRRRPCPGRRAGNPTRRRRLPGGQPRRPGLRLVRWSRGGRAGSEAARRGRSAKWPSRKARLRVRWRMRLRSRWPEDASSLLHRRLVRGRRPQQPAGRRRLRRDDGPRPGGPARRGHLLPVRPGAVHASRPHRPARPRGAAKDIQYEVFGPDLWQADFH
jgi:hypothetical protein